MANKELFVSANRRPSETDTVNLAGGNAYSLDDKNALAQYVVTGVFGNTYYEKAGEQLDRVKKLCQNVEPEFIAKLAVYGRQNAKMKDTPAYLLAHLCAIGELNLVRKIFDRVINNPKMLYNFVQIVRSGQTGRKSFGTAVKRLIQNWIRNRDGDKLFLASVGYSNPSMADVIKMVHPRPKHDAQSTLFAYLLGAKVSDEEPYDLYMQTKNGQVKVGEFDQLPPLVQDFEWFKYDNTQPLPDLDYRALTNCDLTVEHWEQITTNMPWNTLRLNLNTLARNGVFNNPEIVDYVVNKLSSESEIKKWNVFPYQILTSYRYASSDVPQVVRNALQKALDIALNNVPKIGNRVGVAIDVSGSMGSPITGWNTGRHQSVVTCKEVAALIGTAIARTSPHVDIVPFGTKAVHFKDFNPYDSVYTNVTKLERVSRITGHGTNAAIAMNLLNKLGSYDFIVFVSDCQSWVDSYTSDGLMRRFLQHKNKNVKLAEINVQPYGDSQGDTLHSRIMNIGGFSDAVFDVLKNFAERDDNTSFAQVIEESVEL